MNWLTLENPQDVPSPGLLIDPDRIRSNIHQMVSMVGGLAHVDRLRPHVKTHKMGQIVELQLEVGISKFKAATITEARMAAIAGATDVLLAHQPVGPKIEQLAQLIEQSNETSFAAIVDDVGVAENVADRLGNESVPFRLFIDVDCGMGRTGISFGDGLDRLRDRIEILPGVTFAGLHVYDGHVEDPSLDERKQKAGEIIGDVRGYCDTHPTPAVVAGGSPTFGVWAEQTDWECSPGTSLLWDVGYGRAFPDLPFELAAALITRVISKPGENKICLDLGHKAVGSEMPLAQRVYFPDLEGAVAISHNEEHLVLELPASEDRSVGDVLIGYSTHICPTVALHARAALVSGGIATGETWAVVARDR